MATATRSGKANVLHDVPWDVYETLRAAEGNAHVRMTYHDGTLILMSPLFAHDRYAERFGLIVRAVAAASGMPLLGARTTTLKRKGPGRKKGVGKEPDNSFYLANERLMRDKETIDLQVDLPPDLAIEVDHTSDSRRKLPVYARLRVPEVWRYQVAAGTLWFGRLQADGSYAPIERSDGLPMLTPALVLEALERCRGLDESTWGEWLRDWARNDLAARDREGGPAAP